MEEVCQLYSHTHTPHTTHTTHTTLTGHNSGLHSVLQCSVPHWLLTSVLCSPSTGAGGSLAVSVCVNCHIILPSSLPPPSLPPSPLPPSLPPPSYLQLKEWYAEELVQVHEPKTVLHGRLSVPHLRCTLWPAQWEESEGGEGGGHTSQKAAEDHLSRCSTKLRHSSPDMTRYSLMSLKLPWG